ncbi:MAG TPA: CbiX/SirB N-terminal domain-containing protein [Jatrophihabitans sp.]|uniref:sirohydrochlorin chelatase n=1 Tax=Jatrophihabitans sp. TaxID=1932789 RepID=UPI002DF9D0CC|nr:CbiX/SirB N-terminal domain-containing protein [Jatrophihabitans sp.]
MVAHGTASPAGSATTARLVAAVAAARPAVPVELCFLDVVDPRLAAALAGSDEPTIVVPLLLSTGYHVQTDIPAAAAPHPNVRVARHLGPHPLLVDAVLDRMPRAEGIASTALVGAGSTRSGATTELAATGELLAERVGHPVTVLTMADDLRTALEQLPAPRQVATYLLADGQFVTTLHTAAAGLALVGEPIGVHPKLVELVWTRYDEVLAG